MTRPRVTTRRVTLYLTPAQHARLARLRRETGSSVAELIRRAVEQTYPPAPKAKDTP